MKELQSLNLSQNRLKSPALEPLPYLQRINMAGTVGRRQPVSCCRSLVRFLIAPRGLTTLLCASSPLGNKIKTLAGMDHPNLEHVTLSNNRIKDALALTTPSVTYLNLSGNK